MRGLIIVVGAGPGVGGAVARRFAHDEPSVSAATLGVQKAAMRNLIRSLDRRLSEDGVRAVSVTVQGALSRDEESPFHPTRVAEALHAAARQDETDWQTEVPHHG